MLKDWLAFHPRPPWWGWKRLPLKAAVLWSLWEQDNVYTRVVFFIVVCFFWKLLLEALHLITFMDLKRPWIGYQDGPSPGSSLFDTYNDILKSYGLLINQGLGRKAGEAREDSESFKAAQVMWLPISAKASGSWIAIPGLGSREVGTAKKWGIYWVTLLFHITSGKWEAQMLRGNEGRSFPGPWSLLLSTLKPSGY